ncbi:hypothetical protein N9954_00730 [Maribacter sp.]|nr:hypothetical protein [Maribacter sp.]
MPNSKTLDESGLDGPDPDSYRDGGTQDPFYQIAVTKILKQKKPRHMLRLLAVWTGLPPTADKPSCIGGRASRPSNFLTSTYSTKKAPNFLRASCGLDGTSS